MQRKWLEVSVFTEFICIFVVINKEYKILQAIDKTTNYFSEIASFFLKSSRIKNSFTKMRLTSLSIVLTFSIYSVAQNQTYEGYNINNDISQIGQGEQNVNINAFHQIFEGDEDGMIYEKEKLLYIKPSINNDENPLIPPSVFLKVWKTETNGNSKTTKTTSTVHVYWIGEKNPTEHGKQLWEGMKSIYGIKKLTFTTKEDSVVHFYGIPAQWLYDDTLYVASDAKKYGNCLVTEPSRLFLIEQINGAMIERPGTTIVREKSRLAADLNRIMNLTNGTFMLIPHKIDRPRKEEQMMNLFARDVSVCSQITPLGIQREYNLTLFLDSIGSPTLYNSLFSVKDSIDSVLISDLESSIASNQHDTFCRLVTVNGAIFPWKYLKATYLNGIWYFKDIIWTDEEKEKYYLEFHRKTTNSELLHAVHENNLYAK